MIEPMSVGAAVQRYLSGGLADGEPRSLDVADVVQNQSADGDYANVFQW